MNFSIPKWLVLVSGIILSVASFGTLAVYLDRVYGEHTIYSWTPPAPPEIPLSHLFGYIVLFGALFAVFFYCVITGLKDDYNKANKR